MDTRKKRRTIGVLASGITDDYTQLLCKGVLQQAQKEKVNIVVLPGKYLERNCEQNPDLMYEYQHGTLLTYARPETLDGVIVAAECFGCFMSAERLATFMEQYRNMPCILASSKIQDFPSVNYDNYNGIVEGLRYMIEVLGLRKFAMIGGPDDNTNSRQRKETFQGIMRQYSIPWKDSQYVNGELSICSGELVHVLLEKNPDLEAIFCVNDDIAVSVIHELKKVGILAGRDISVLGYDNAVLAAKIFPSLSTVMADIAELGATCLKQLMDIIDGKTCEDLILPTRFIKRESIISESKESVRGMDSSYKEIDFQQRFEDIFYRFKYNHIDGELESVKAAFLEFVNALVSWGTEEEKGAEKKDRIQRNMDIFLNHKMIAYADMDNLLSFLENMQQQLMEVQHNHENEVKLSDLFVQIYRQVIHVMNYHLGKLLERDVNESNAIKVYARNMMQFEQGSDYSYEMLLGKMEWLGVHNAYILMYENPIVHLDKEAFLPPNKLYLKAVRKADQVTVVPAIDQEVNLKDIFRSEWLGLETFSLVAIPLFSNELLYGIVLCDLTQGIFENGEYVSDQMSAATKIIDLLKSNEKIQQQLEESLATLKENNIALDNLSKSDGLTGISNRRGFYDAAEKLLVQQTKQNQSLCAIYLDMNNLKIINDRYGHDEGDFSLKSIGQILMKLFGSNGVVGRIGGDEFACVVPIDNSLEERQLINAIYMEFEDFNKKSDKEYNITVSAGGYVMRKEESLTLEQVLSLADEQLYEVKKFRTKEVVKAV